MSQSITRTGDNDNYKETKECGCRKDTYYREGNCRPFMIEPDECATYYHFCPKHENVFEEMKKKYHEDCKETRRTWEENKHIWEDEHKEEISESRRKRKKVEEEIFADKNELNRQLLEQVEEIHKAGTGEIANIRTFGWTSTDIHGKGSWHRRDRSEPKYNMKYIIKYIHFWKEKGRYKCFKNQVEKAEELYDEISASERKIEKYCKY